MEIRNKELRKHENVLERRKNQRKNWLIYS